MTSTTQVRRPFRFTAQLPDLTGPIEQWRDEVRRLEDIGFSTVALADHFTGGYTLEDAPGVLVGSTARCAEKLHALRDRLGISYVQVHAGPRGTVLGGIGQVVGELAGT